MSNDTLDDIMEWDETETADEVEAKPTRLEDSPYEYFLVSRSQLTQLFQRCLRCGRLPRGRGVPPKRLRKSKTPPPRRTLFITTRGTSVTISWYCTCKDGGKNRQSWSTQPLIEGTEMRSGNLSIAAAMVAAPIDYPAMKHFSSSLQMPMFSNVSFYDNKRLYVQPMIKELYLEQQKHVLALVAYEPLKLALDGQYDSPGYSSELCRVTALDATTNLVVTFAVSHKAEVGGVSNRMELLGVKKVLREKSENCHFGFWD